MNINPINIKFSSNTSATPITGKDNKVISKGNTKDRLKIIGLDNQAHSIAFKRFSPEVDAGSSFYPQK